LFASSFYIRFNLKKIRAQDSVVRVASVAEKSVARVTGVTRDALFLSTSCRSVSDMSPKADVSSAAGVESTRPRHFRQSLPDLKIVRIINYFNFELF
jgi:hypothetical protein